MADLYREIVPGADLAGRVACLWVHRTVAAGVHRVVPDACSDIICVGDAPPRFVGPATKPALIRLPAGTLVVGARFLPGMAPAVLSAPLDGLRNEEVPLEELWSPSAAAALLDRVAGARCEADKVRALERELGSRLHGRAPPDRRVVAAARRLAAAGRPTSRALAGLGLGERQLQRLFREAVGYGPKMLQRILRFQRLMLLVQRRSAVSAAELAQRAGYADQAHMAREVMEFSGETPAVFLEGAVVLDTMSAFFNTRDGG